MKLEFEDFDDDYHQRAKVPGGWLVKSIDPVSHAMPDGGMADGWDWRTAMAFVPDINHEWKIDNKTLARSIEEFNQAVDREAANVMSAFSDECPECGRDRKGDVWFGVVAGLLACVVGISAMFLFFWFIS